MIAVFCSFCFRKTCGSEANPSYGPPPDLPAMRCIMVYLTCGFAMEIGQAWNNMCLRPDTDQNLKEQTEVPPRLKAQRTKQCDRNQSIMQTPGPWFEGAQIPFLLSSLRLQLCSFPLPSLQFPSTNTDKTRSSNHHLNNVGFIYLPTS